jgi:hypothetical protein
MREALSDPVRVRRPVRLVGLTVLLLAAVGCNSRHQPVPVRGQVTLDGKPVEGATVTFYAEGNDKDGRPAFGYTDKAGEFRLSTLGNEDGALRREYKVVITKYVPSEPNLKIPDFPNTPEGRSRRDDFLYRHYQGKSPIKNVLPDRYGALNKTPFTCNVTGKTDDASFELKSK